MPSQRDDSPDKSAHGSIHGSVHGGAAGAVPGPPQESNSFTRRNRELARTGSVGSTGHRLVRVCAYTPACTPVSPVGATGSALWWCRPVSGVRGGSARTVLRAGTGASLDDFWREICVSSSCFRFLLYPQEQLAEVEHEQDHGAGGQHSSGHAGAAAGAEATEEDGGERRSAAAAPAELEGAGAGEEPQEAG